MPSKISVRDDGTILLNAAPFFPIGLYYAQEEIVDESGAGLQRLREMGFNTIFFEGGLESESLFNRIGEAGLMVWCRLPGGLYREFGLLKRLCCRNHF